MWGNNWTSNKKYDEWQQKEKIVKSRKELKLLDIDMILRTQNSVSLHYFFTFFTFLIFKVYCYCCDSFMNLNSVQSHINGFKHKYLMPHYFKFCNFQIEKEEIIPTIEKECEDFKKEIEEMKKQVDYLKEDLKNTKEYNIILKKENDSLGKEKVSRILKKLETTKESLQGYKFSDRDVEQTLENPEIFIQKFEKFLKKTKTQKNGKELNDIMRKVHDLINKQTEKMVFKRYEQKEKKENSSALFFSFPAIEILEKTTLKELKNQTESFTSQGEPVFFFNLFKKEKKKPLICVIFDKNAEEESFFCYDFYRRSNLCKIFERNLKNITNIEKNFILNDSVFQKFVSFFEKNVGETSEAFSIIENIDFFRNNESFFFNLLKNVVVIDSLVIVYKTHLLDLKERLKMFSFLLSKIESFGFDSLVFCDLINFFEKTDNNLSNYLFEIFKKYSFSSICFCFKEKNEEFSKTFGSMAERKKI